MPHAKCLFIDSTILAASAGWGKAEIWGEYAFMWFAFLDYFMLMNSIFKKWVVSKSGKWEKMFEMGKW